MKDNNLIDSIEDRRDYEYLAYIPPTFAQQMVPAVRNGNKSPAIRRMAFPGVSQSGAYRKEGSYGWLK